jgi:hypothetical protein
MQKKSHINLILILGIVFLSVGFVSADIIATIGMQGLEFVHPGLATTVRSVMCAAGPWGVFGCVSQYVEGKIIGAVSGEVMQTLADVSPDAANAIVTYNQIKGYVDQGANIINNLQINEKGELKDGELKSNGQSIDISKMINSELEEGSIVTNGEILFFDDEEADQAAIITFNSYGENTFQTTYIDSKTGERKTTVIEGISNTDYGDKPLNNYIKINKEGEIIEASIHFYGRGNKEPFIIGGLEVDPILGKFYYDGRGKVKTFEFTGKVLSLPQFKEDEAIIIEGDQVDFPDDLRVYGTTILDKKGYYIGEGSVVYNKISIKDTRETNYYRESNGNIKGHPNILIPYSEEDLPKDYEGAYIIAKENSIKFEAKRHTYDPFPENGPDILKLKFEGDNEYIETTDKTKFEIFLNEQEGFEIIKRENQPSKINYLYGGGGSKMFNDGMELDFYWSGVSSKIIDYDLDLNALKQGKYQPVEFELEIIDKEYELPFLEGGKMTMDSNGILTVKDHKLNDRVLYKRYGLSDNLKNGMSKEDFEDYENKFAEVAMNRKDLHFNGNNYISFAIKSNLTSNQMKDLILKTPLGDRAFNSEEMVKAGVVEGFHIGVETDKVIDLTNTALEEVKPFGTGSTTTDLVRALSEYKKDGNYEDVKSGFKIVTKYSSGAVSLFDIEDRGWDSDENQIKFADLKTKEDLAKTIASEINKYSQKITNNKIGGDTFSNYEMSAVLINELHSNEDLLDGADDIRDIISENLNLDSKYYLISKANSDLFQSTFDDIYNTLGEDTIKRIKEEIDPEGKYWFDFVMETASRNRADDLLVQDPEFFKDAISKSLENVDSRELLKNGAFLTNTFVEIYEKPEFEKEKEYFGDFLLERYNDAETKEKKGVYGYLMKLNEGNCNPPIKEKYKTMCNELPPIPNIDIPNKWSADDKIAAKFYFYDDEAWFGATSKDYQKPPYNFNLIERDDSTAVLTKIVNGKELKIVLTLDNSDVQEAVEGDEFDIIAHRGHSFHLEDTFTGNSDNEKLFYLGSCGSFRETPNLQKKYPNAYLISDENTGQGAVNNRVSYELMYRLAQDTTTWESLGKDLGDEAGLVFPHEKNQLLLRYINQIKGL